MKDLFKHLESAGFVVTKGEDNNCFRVDGEFYALSVSFHDGNYCDNRLTDYGWACENAEVHIWERNPPYMSVNGPDGGVWGWRNPEAIVSLIDQYVGAPK